MSIIYIETTPQFKELVNNTTLSVIMFGAKWCNPCTKSIPELERLAFRYPKVVFSKVDVEECPEIVEKCYIKALPTFMYCRGGKQLGYTIGADMRDVKNQIQRYLTGDEKV